MVAELSSAAAPIDRLPMLAWFEKRARSAAVSAVMGRALSPVTPPVVASWLMIVPIRRHRDRRCSPTGRSA
jgi:hypothetical protein